MTIFLTGATGYTGGVVLEHLLRAGHEVTALTRKAMPAQEGVRWIAGDFSEQSLIRRVADAADATVHIGASHDEAMEALDRHVITAVADAYRGTGRLFVTTSATPVYGDTGSAPRDEREPIVAPHPKRAWRARHDRLVADLNEEKMRGVVIRPGHIYGRGGGLLADSIRRARATGRALYIGTGRYPSSTVHVDALAELYLLVIKNADARGIYNAVSDEIMCDADTAAVIAALFGPDITAQSWPLDQARAELGELADLVTMTCVAQATRARSELGWLPNAPSLLSELVGGSYRTAPLADYHFAEQTAK